MDLRLKGKKILVTAASQGLGFSVAKALVEEDAKIILCARTEGPLKEAVSTLGPNAKYKVADVSKADDITSLLDSLDSLDGLFVNAGGPSPGEFSDLEDTDWAQAFELTLLSAVRLTRAAIPLLKKGESPSILYSTSISVKQPIRNLLLSNALRPAVIGMMRTLSQEIATDGIRINAVCPGYIHTQRVEELISKSKTTSSNPLKSITSQIPIGRMGQPDEFGAVCAFLFSPIASYIHGALLLIDGGLYKGMM